MFISDTFAIIFFTLFFFLCGVVHNIPFFPPLFREINFLKCLLPHRLIESKMA